MDIDGKKLVDLRVVDLKQQLEKRSLDICGVKSTLAERLKNALLEEGEDPDTFVFGLEKSPTKSKVAVDQGEQESSADLKDEPEALNESDMQDLVVKDDIDEPAMGEAESVPEEPKGAQEEEASTNVVDQHMLDNEDSLNLTIGEDEAKLLQGEENEDKQAITTATVAMPGKETEEQVNEKVNRKEGEPKSENPESSSVQTDQPAKDSDKKAATKNGSGSAGDGKETSVISSSTKTTQKSSTATGGATVASNSNGAAANPSAATGGAASPAGSTADSGKGGASGRNLWVSGLSSTTRATDLKQLFSKYGKVIGAKVVTNTKMPGSRCYGYVTMNAADDALKCVEHLHRTELHGRMISVEKAKTELSAPKSGSATSAGSSAATPSAGGGSSATNKSSGAASHKKPEGAKKPFPASSSAKGKDAPKPAPDHTRSSATRRERGEDLYRRGGGRGPPPCREHNGSGSNTRRLDHSTSRTSKAPLPHRDDASRLAKERERDLDRERERQRIQRDREQFEAERLRHEREKARLKEKLEEEERRCREARRRAREEEEKLARERKKIQVERARLEREKTEILRLERQKLERERLELERQEIKRQQMKVEEAKRNLKRPAEDRESGSSSRYNESDRDRKRPAHPHPERHFEAPPPPRFESSIRMSGAEKKRDDYPIKRESGNYSGSSRSTARDDFVGAVVAKRAVADDYVRPSNKRDDYDSPKRSDDYGPAKRDRRESDYKRDGYNKRGGDLNDIPPRHSNSSGGGSNYNAIASHGRGGGADNDDMLMIQKPYIEHAPSDNRGASGGFRRTIANNNMNNVTLTGGSNNGGGSGMQSMIIKDDRSSRYMDNTSQNDMRYGGNDRGMAAPWSNNAGPMPVSKAFGNSVQGGGGSGVGGGGQSDPWKADDWRNLDSAQDRYDRTYNERKSPYMEQPVRQSSGAGFLNRPQDRYNSMSSSRFDSGRF